jgi:predicted nucleic acid-binding protein
MIQYVIDASVILGYLLQKNKEVAEKATALLKGLKAQATEIYAPSLLFTEVANGLRFSLRDEGIAMQQFEKFSRLPIRCVSFSASQMKEIIRLSFQLDATVYDVSYHFLAILHGGIFLTCDADYFRKAKRLGKIELVT